MPSSPSNPATAALMRSLSAVESSSVAVSGAANERSTDSGRPDFDPGV